MYDAKIRFSFQEPDSYTVLTQIDNGTTNFQKAFTFPSPPSKADLVGTIQAYLDSLNAIKVDAPAIEALVGKTLTQIKAEK
jgi:hypothetical protein